MKTSMTLMAFMSVLLMLQGCDPSWDVEKSFIGHLAGLAMEYRMKNDFENAIKVSTIIYKINIKRGFDVYRGDMIHLAHWYGLNGQYHEKKEIYNEIIGYYEVNNREKDGLYFAVQRELTVLRASCPP